MIALLALFGELPRSRVLDVGTGSGHIAEELATVAAGVVSVDVLDERVARDGFEFVLSVGDRLPFADGAFDIVISNHVVEHVADQATHVAELLRVVRPGGVVYLATPNRRWPVDPHHRLPFIAWLPRRAADRYLRVVRGRGTRWDIHPLADADVRRLISGARLINALPLLAVSPASVSLDIWRPAARLARRLPRRWLELTRHLSPTLIYLVRPPAR